MNLGYGSALASIGLTIPTIGIISLMLDMRLVLGLEPVHMALLVLTGLMSALTIVQGRALRLQGAMHLVVAAAYVFLVAVP
ncbi:Calcium/proton antiporter [Chlamydia trachomatis]|nr:Calcium/proton antiporter [Chlamydia trachomatis]